MVSRWIRAKPSPSPGALEKRIAKAERQAAFAARAGWPDVAELYRRLAADLRAMLPDADHEDDADREAGR